MATTKASRKASEHVTISTDWLMPALDELGLAYSVRETPDGVPYAGFGLAGSGGRLRSLTAIEQSDGQVLRLTAHGLAEQSLQDLMTVTRRLPVGRALRSPDTGEVEFAMSCYVGEEGLSSSHLGTLLGYVESALHAIDGSPPPSWPVIEGETDLTLVDLTAPAARRGPPVVHEESVDVDFVMDGSSCHLSAGVRPGGWMVVLATWDGVPPESRSADEWDTLQRLQNWTTAGRYLVLDDGALVVEVGTPALRGDVTRCTDWSMSQATLMLQVAARHLLSGERSG